jgi:hypothetical protein
MPDVTRLITERSSRSASRDPKREDAGPSGAVNEATGRPSVGVPSAYWNGDPNPTMDGIVFFATERERRVVDFYRDRLGAEMWLDQDGCTILRQGEFRFGFCERDRTDDCGILTFYVEDRTTVDERYDDLVDCARGPPETNEQYEIYRFFAEDPDGRTVEVQTFLHPLPDET